MKINLTALLAGIVVLLLIIIGYFLFINKSFFTRLGPAAISGTFNINGVIPQGATLSLTQRIYNEEVNPVAFAEGITPTDQGAWNFPDAVTGSTYEIQALVQVNGKTIAQSTPLTVTAPADNETLTLNIPADNPTNQSAVISGSIQVNGYIPSGATIQIQGKEVGETSFTTVASNLQAAPRQAMSYTTAIAGTTYDIVGKLFDATGNQIGISSTLQVTAPALDEVLTINSTAQPPATPTPATPPAAANTPTPTTSAVTLSGSINFNGAAPANSRIVILQKQMNSNNYQVAVDNITPMNGSTWTWNSASSGTWYNLIAVLKQRQSNGTDQDLADSSTITIAAPANNIQMTINSGVSLPAPGGPITMTCNSQSGSNAWNVTVNFQSVQNAQSYWFQIGSSNGGTDKMNQTQNATNTPTQQVSPSFQSGVTYYAQYAYANVPNAQVGSNEFSAFSGTTSMICQ